MSTCEADQGDDKGLYKVERRMWTYMNAIKKSANFIMGHISCRVENKAVATMRDHHESVQSTD